MLSTFLRMTDYWLMCKCLCLTLCHINYFVEYSSSVTFSNHLKATFSWTGCNMSHIFKHSLGAFFCVKWLLQKNKKTQQIHFNSISRTDPCTRKTCLRSSMKYTTHADERYITTDFIIIHHTLIYTWTASQQQGSSRHTVATFISL